MAEVSRVRIRPGEAGHLLWLSAVMAVSSPFDDDPEREEALAFLRAALPGARVVPAVGALIGPVEELLAAAPQRRTASGGRAWAQAMARMQLAVLRVARGRVAARLEAAA